MGNKKLPHLRRRRSLGSGDMRRRLAPQLSDEQLLILGLLLVVLLAISMLYCLGFASLAIRDNWQRAPLPWNGTTPVEELPSVTPSIDAGAGAMPPGAGQ